MKSAPLLQDVQDRPAAPKHSARLYRTDAELADAVSRFIVEGLRRGEAVLVIATAANWALFVARLARHADIDLASTIVNGQLRIMDADLALSVVMSDGMPAWCRVHETASSIIEGGRKRFGGIRVYGEMVNILWQKGNRAAAEELELHWNALAYRYPVTRLCAYRVCDSDPDAYNELLGCVCRSHAEVTPPHEQAGEIPGKAGNPAPPVLERQVHSEC